MWAKLPLVWKPNYLRTVSYHVSKDEAMRSQKILLAKLGTSNDETTQERALALLQEITGLKCP